MTTAPLPVAISCGEPAGIGPEVAAQAWSALKDDVPMVWLGDPRHLPADVPFVVVADASQAAEQTPTALPVLARDFGPAATPGTPQPQHKD